MLEIETIHHVAVAVCDLARAKEFYSNFLGLKEIPRPAFPFEGAWYSAGSRDEKVLYLNNSNGEYLLAFDVQPDGSLTNRRNFAKYDGVRTNAAGVPSSGADGITIDSQGRLYVAASNGVQVFTSQGQHLGTIPMPRPPQNVAFAGPDKKTLYVVGRGVVSKVQMVAEGFKDRAK